MTSSGGKSRRSSGRALVQYDWCPRKEAHTGRTPRDGEAEVRDTSISQGTPRMAITPQKLGKKSGTDPPSLPQTSRLQNVEIMISIVSAAQSVVPSHSSRRKPMQCVY